MNKKFNKDPYELVKGDKVLLQKFFSSKHLSFTNFHQEKIGKLATFLGFVGYRDRQAVIELRNGTKLHWRTESLKYVKQHTTEEVEEMTGYGKIEPVQKTITVNNGSSTVWGGLSPNGTTSKVGIIPTPDNPNIIMYGRIEVCNEEVCKADDKKDCTCDGGNVQENKRINKILDQKVTDYSKDINSFPISPSEAYIKPNFTNQVITEEKAVEILKDPKSFLRQLEQAMEKVIVYPEFNKHIDITNPYDILKELVRLRNLYNSMPSNSFDYIISFEENNSNQKIITVKLKDFNRSIFTFNSENKAKTFLEKNGEYLKIISKTFY